eukprot:1236298-Rhodomonas_salina.1
MGRLKEWDSQALQEEGGEAPAAEAAAGNEAEAGGVFVTREERGGRKGAGVFERGRLTHAVGRGCSRARILQSPYRPGHHRMMDLVNRATFSS